MKIKGQSKEVEIFKSVPYLKKAEESVRKITVTGEQSRWQTGTRAISIELQRQVHGRSLT